MLWSAIFCGVFHGFCLGKMGTFVHIDSTTSSESPRHEREVEKLVLMTTRSIVPAS